MKIWARLLILLIWPLLFGFPSLAGEAGADGDEWPKWRGQNQDGKSSEKGVFSFPAGYALETAWKNKLGSGYSSISIAAGRAVTMFSDGSYDYLVALDADTGAELWRYKIDTTYKGHNNSHDGPIATPVIDGDWVFGLGRKGQILALDVGSGKAVWSRDLRSDFHSRKPFHGFGTSPLVYGDVLLVQTGGGEGQSVSGFDKRTGEVLWGAEKEVIDYQSPILARLGGTDQVVYIGNKNVFGLAPYSGERLWKYTHDLGDSSDALQVDSGRLFLTGSSRESIFLAVKNETDMYTVEELWRSRGIRSRYSVSVPYQGHIYGYSNRFLACIDSETGKTIWKSRQPGVGFLLFVDGHLIILTREGTLHVVKASPEGYREQASLKLFEPFAWTPPSFAYGKIYARSLQEIACVRIVGLDGNRLDKGVAETGSAGRSEFGSFIGRLENSSDQESLIDEFMSGQKHFPIIENDTWVHVVYRGEVRDLAIRGDMLDSGKEVPMNRVGGTHFYYYSFQLEPDARVNYQLVKDFEEPMTDPLNSRKVPSQRDEQSEIAMPMWIPPKHLDEPVGQERGRIETIQFQSKILDSSRTVQIYLPRGYSEGRSRYPVLYVHFTKGAIEWSKMTNTLDNLIGKTIRPMISVFVDADSDRAFKELPWGVRQVGDKRHQYARMLAEELVPYIDRNYRTDGRPESRSIMGAGLSGFISLYTALKQPGVFSCAAGQSSYLRHGPGDELKRLVETEPMMPVRFYLDWGKYDERVDEYGHTNRIRSNRTFAKLLKDKGYVLTAVEANDGYGWASWRNRTDKILETFFPLNHQH